MTISNITTSAVTVIVKPVAGASVISNSCQGIANEQDSADALQIVAAPSSTTHVTFPEPFVTAPVAGTYVCLVVGADPAYDGVNWSAVGYKIFP